MELTEIGWNPGLAQAFAGFGSQGLIPARVARAHSVSYLVYAEAGELNAELTGRLRHLAGSSRELPTVGDWVAVRQVDQDRGMVHAVLPRKSCFSRREAGGRTKEGGGRTAEQVVAANVDTVFLVSDLDRDFNLRRMERYLTLVWDSGADPVIVLNKADRCDAVEARVAEMEGVACGVPIHPVSAVSGAGLGSLGGYLTRGRTVALLGSSGVGKSTLINCLAGREVLAVGAVRTGDGRGRHTTTHRELVLLPGGGVLVDNPGMREVQLWGDEEGLKGTFGDIEALAAGCRFRDCRHEREPGCAVLQALQEGGLELKRWENYQKMQKELRHLEARQDQRVRMLEKERGKQIARWSRQFDKNR